jgi:murein L,D-transpeptidase YcbB/YkuD
MRTYARSLVLAATLLVALPSLSIPASESAEQVIQLAVDALRTGAPVKIGDATISATVVLPTLYERRGFQPAWTSPQAVDDLLRAIRDSEADGLDPHDYHLAAIEGLQKTPAGNADRDGNLDLLLTDATTRLAYHLRFGKVDPEALDPNWNRTSQLANADPASTLQEAIDKGKVYDTLDALKPRYRFYTALKQSLADHRRIAAAGGWPVIPSGPKLQVGTSDPRVPLLRKRLAITGDLPEAAAAETATQYDAALAAGVKAFQERHGLPSDGALGPGTLEAMNVPVARRIDQIRATLERCRWVMHDVPERFVLVNVAGFTVTFFGKDGPTWESRVVVGKTSTKTPIFWADMTYVVVNPTWTVPPGMMRNEVGPGMRRDPNYLQKKGYQLINGQVVQPAGPRNALGRIKLVFPNPHSVYLHDTPSKSFFNETTRTFSHGCVRVAKPFELAALVLDDPAWTTETLLAAADTNKTRTIVLKKPMPVLLLYWTASVGRDDRTYFLPDVYGRDPAIIRALGQGFAFRKGFVLARPAAVSGAR